MHAFVNDLERPVGTYLYGRRMYETMVGWETDPSFAEHSPVMRDFAEIWRAAVKIVYSRTLESASTARTRIERHLDPDTVRELKAAGGGDLTVGGPELAAHAFRAGPSPTIADARARHIAGNPQRKPESFAWAHAGAA